MLIQLIFANERLITFTTVVSWTGFDGELFLFPAGVQEGGVGEEH